MAVRRRDPGDRVLRGRRQAAHEHLHQLADAEPGRRHAGQHRVERAARDRRLEVGDQLVVRDALPGQVAVEQVVVLRLGDDPLHERVPAAARCLDVLRVGGPCLELARGRVEHRPGQQPDQPRGAVVVREQGQVKRLDRLLAEQPLADLQDRLEVTAGQVHVGDDDDARHPDGRALVPRQPGRPVDAVDGRHDEDGGIRSSQTGSQLADEVRVARACRSTSGAPSSMARPGAAPACGPRPATPTGRAASRRPRSRSPCDPSATEPARGDRARCRPAGPRRGWSCPRPCAPRARCCEPRRSWSGQSSSGDPSSARLGWAPLWPSGRARATTRRSGRKGVALALG